MPVLLAAAALAGCAGTSAGAAQAGGAPAGLFAGWRTDVHRHVVPLSEFQSGGPGKDGIPAVDRPRFAPARATRYLQPREPLIELTVHGQTRGYPLEILIWHEIVNDRIAGVPVAVTFCPLCNTAIAFDRRLGGTVLDFGTTGNLRNSDLVMYDRQSESWWQQFSGQALVGRFAGRTLGLLPARIVSWRDFLTRHPNALVLTRHTGYARPYGENPYQGYDDVSSPPFFPVRNGGDRRLPPKQRVVYIEAGRESVAVSEALLARKKVVRVRIGGHQFVVRATGTAATALGAATIADARGVVTARVTENGRPVPFTEPFWFAVAAFRPHTRVIR
ncbi:MAG: DUF3179 domain-containing protein [Acidobacteriota bacterium]|nr:DUF3179 domain-containing protein [Acidobacteriota bacterium]